MRRTLLDTFLDTFLDTPTEVHAATHGIYAGMTEWKGAELPDNPDVVAEPNYFRGGYIAGTLIRWGMAVFIIMQLS